MFKLALLHRKYDQVLAFIRGSALCGQSIIAYLQQKGFPEVALHFVRDERTRFNLAVECGNIDVALTSASEIDEKETWYRLGVEALRQGNHQIVEFAYQKTKNFERLSFLYLITGNIEKLAKMMKIAEMRQDVMGRFHNALYLGDVRERCKILQETKQFGLAYATAVAHNLEDKVAELEELLGDRLPDVSAMVADAKLMLPPQPILREDNWPLLTVTKGFFEGGAPLVEEEAAGGGFGMTAEEMVGAEDMEGGWGDEDALELPGDTPMQYPSEPREDGEEDDDEDGGWEMEDLELPPDAAEASGPVESAFFVAPSQGVPVAVRWGQKCGLAGQQAAAGCFDAAMRLLNRQLGIASFEPMRPYFLDLTAASGALLPGLPGVGAISSPMGAGWSAEDAPAPPTAPALLYTLASLEDSLKRAYKLTTEGKFTEALKLFSSILHILPLVVVDTRKEVDDVKELQSITREYANALRIELQRKETKDDVERSAELAAYFTHCNLQPIHLSLSLRSAMSIFFKLKNFDTAATFCRRLLELNPPPKVAQQARQVLSACEKTPGEAVRVAYDARNPFVVCAKTLTPIYRGTKDVQARFAPPAPWARSAPTPPASPAPPPSSETARSPHRPARWRPLPRGGGGTALAGRPSIAGDGRRRPQLQLASRAARRPRWRRCCPGPPRWRRLRPSAIGSRPREHGHVAGGPRRRAGTLIEISICAGRRKLAAAAAQLTGRRRGRSGCRSVRAPRCLSVDGTHPHVCERVDSRAAPGGRWTSCEILRGAGATVRSTLCNSIGNPCDTPRAPARHRLHVL
eukprot:1188644-Prorocentrum_minimum.AAC.6